MPPARTRQRTVRGESSALTCRSASCTIARIAGSIRMPVSIRLDRQGAEGSSDSAPRPSRAASARTVRLSIRACTKG